MAYNKYDYPKACADAGEKKFDDCTQCGMCDGTVDEKDPSSNNSISKKSQAGLSKEEIESIVDETVKRIKDNM